MFTTRSLADPTISHTPQQARTLSVQEHSVYELKEHAH